MAMSREELAEVFDNMDTDKSGQVDRAEITKLLAEFMTKGDEKQAGEIAQFIIDACDTDADAKLTKDEFVNTMEKYGM